MWTTQSDRRHLQSRRFLILYALAAAGGAAAYVPFLTLLLPLHVMDLWGQRGFEVLSYAAFVGAVAASLANIAFGWASDRSRNRKRWIIAGLIISSILLILMREAESIQILLVMIILWQLALNMMLNPLMAIAGDLVPNEQKGVLGGLLSLSPAFGAFTGALITIPGLAGPDTRLLLNAGLVIAMILPLILFGNPRPMPHLMRAPLSGADGEKAEFSPAEPAKKSPVKRMWLVRLLVQIAEVALFAFLLLWFRSVDGDITENDTAQIFTVVLTATVPLALMVGRWSDRIGRPMLPLMITAGGASVGLLVLAGSTSAQAGVFGYVLFGVMAGTFLALHASQTLRVLPRPKTRGRDLGIFNLTNTIPSLIMPWLVLALIPAFGFQALFLFLATLSGLACLLLMTMQRV